MKSIVIIIVILIILGGGWWLFSQNNTVPAPVVTPPITDEEPNPPTPTTEQPTTVKEFTVTGSGFKFSPTEIKVKQGDTVRVTFKNAEGFHDWKLDEFKVATKQIKAGEQETVEFVADKAGSFEYYCSVGNHRQMGMKGTLVVEA